MTETDLWHWIATLKVAHRPSVELYSVWVDDPRGLHATGQSLEDALSKAAQALEASRRLRRSLPDRPSARPGRPRPRWRCG
jgi:hypothetical protein